MRKRKLLLLLSIAGMLTTGLPAMVANAAWMDTASGRMYTQAGSPGYMTGIQKIENYTYYFNPAGIMQTGFQTIQNNRYYFNALGQMQFGRFVALDGKTYYADKTTGVLAVSKWVSKRYYQADGSMAVNTWIDGKWVGANGRYTGTKSKTGWVTSGNKKYYYTESGTLYKGKLKLNGNYYYLDPSSGALLTGWFKIGKKFYYAQSSGVLVTQKWQDGRYLKSSGAAATGWQDINGNTYYLDPSTGIRKTGVVKIGDARYYFTSGGKLRRNRWVSSKKYYASASGAFLTGLQSIGGSLYYFKPSNGKKVTNKLKKVDSATYYFKNDGAAIKKAWVKIGSKYYYFQASGKMATNKWVGNYYVGFDGVRTNQTKKTGWQTEDGKKYYYNNKGSKVTGWHTISGSKYYFDAGGVMLTGIQTIGDKKHYFYPDGRLATSITLAIGLKEYTIDSEGAITAEKSIKISGNSTGTKIVNFALQYVGNPYVWGGVSLTEGADCSGFVQTVFGHFGIKLLRVADDQMKGPTSALSGDYKTPVIVDASSMQPGDLIFYGANNYATHVAIYMGDGQIVHASNSQPYPLGGIKISNYDYAAPIRVVRYWS